MKGLNRLMATGIIVLITLMSFHLNSFGQVDPPNGKLAFIENKGQFSEDVLFKSSLNQGAAFLKRDGFSYTFFHPEDLREKHDDHHHEEAGKVSRSGLIRGHAFDVRFLNANQNAEVLTYDQKQGYYNYFIGNDPEKWKNRISRFGAIRYEGVYDKIDLLVYSLDRNVKYDFIVRKGGNVEDIKLEYEGLERMEVAENGNLILKTSIGELQELAPFAYQMISGERIQIPCEFKLSGNHVVYHFPKGYDFEQTLVIDPVLMAATYSGSVDLWGATTVHDENTGEIYSIGRALGSAPVTPGAFQIMPGGGIMDIGVSKYSSDGSTLIYCTFLGGEDNDIPIRGVLDNGELYVLSQTGSFSFPVSPTAYSSTLMDTTTLTIPGIPNPFPVGVGDIAVTHFNSTGTGIIGSTYLGGSYIDIGADIVLDDVGNCYVVGTVESSDFPTTPGAYQTVFGGGNSDGVLFKMNSDLSTLFWSTFVGGTENDTLFSVRRSTPGNIFVGGNTASNLPFGTGYQSALQGGADCYIMKFNGSGTSLMAGTYLGTGGNDNLRLMDLDLQGNVYFCGGSVAMPITPGVYNNAAGQNFIAKLSNDLTALEFSTRIGSGAGIFGLPPQIRAFNVDDCGSIYLAKYAEDINGFPITPNPVHTTGHIYALALTPGATAIEVATYVDVGQHSHGSFGHFDDNGVLSMNFCSGPGLMTPTTWAYESTPTGVNDLCTFKIDLQISSSSTSYAIVANDLSVCNGPYEVDFSSTAPDSVDFDWDFGDGNTSTDSVITHTYSVPGTYDVTLILNGLDGCLGTDTLTLAIEIIDLPEPIVDLGNDTTICEGSQFVLDAQNASATYFWQDGTGNQIMDASSPGVYWVEVTDTNGCIGSDTIQVSQLPSPTVDLGPDTILCSMKPFVLNAQNPGLSYLWNDNSINQTFTVNTPGVYWVGVEDANECSSIDSIEVSLTSLFVDLGADTVLCLGTSIVLDAQNPTSTYNWVGTITDQTITVSTPGVYWVEVVDTNNCSATDTIDIDFNDVTASFYPGEQMGCPDLIANFFDESVPSGDIISWNWDFGDGNSSLEQNPEHIYSTPGLYDVSLEVSSGLGCTDDTTISASVHVYPMPQAAFSFTPINVTLDNSTVNFYDESNGAVSWEWDFGDGYSSMVENPTHQYSQVGSYMISLTVETEYGCISETTYALEVTEDILFYLPNTFTPDGDGINNEFLGKGEGIERFHMIIYNRWGEEVFESYNLDSGWDGTSEGKICQDGVYVWKVDVKGKNGNVLELTGHVNVLR